MEAKRNLILKFKSLRKTINKSAIDLKKCGTWSTNNKTWTANSETCTVTSGEDLNPKSSTTFTKDNSKTTKKKPNKPQLSTKKSSKSTMLSENGSILLTKIKPQLASLCQKWKSLSFWNKMRRISIDWERESNRSKPKKKNWTTWQMT